MRVSKLGNVVQLITGPWALSSEVLWLRASYLTAAIVIINWSRAPDIWDDDP